MESAIKTNYFPELTGVRALAAFLVYLHHYSPFTKEVLGDTIFNFIHEFHIGVTLFFVLSGFLIAYRYSEMKNFNFKKYMIFRFARIYPMFFILSTITFLIPLLYHENVFEINKILMYVSNITFLKGFFDSLKFTLIEQSWSLTVEEVFYLLAPLVFLIINKKFIYFFFLPILFIGLGLAAVFVFSRFNIQGFFGTYNFMFNYTFFGRCTEFFIGIGLAILIKRDLIKFKFRYFTYVGFIMIFLSAFCISLVAKEGYGIHEPLGIFINTFILPLLGVSLFYYGLITEKSIFSKFFSSKILVLLGKSSYIFYLIHIGFFRNIFALKIGGIWAYLYIFIILQIIAIILFKFIEEPLNHYFRNKFAFEKKIK
ncbi:MAG: acyltransferase [Flavobacteriales bacterium]|nr:acyltransferase [Flavobacteriales bacterium]